MSDFAGGLMGYLVPAMGNGSATNEAIDATGKKVAFVFAAQEDATITTLLFRYGARTGTPPTYRVSLQGVDATTGAPDGTVLGGGSPASATFTPPADGTWDGTMRRIALANSYNVTRGTVYALVIDHSAGTCDGTNNSSFTRIWNGTASGQGLPYCIIYNGASWAKQTAFAPFGYASASRVYGQPILSAGSTSSLSGELGLAFVLDAGWGAAYTLQALRWFTRQASAARTVTITLYASDGTTALQGITIDLDCTSVSGGGWIRAIFDEASLASLDFGTTYYVGIQASGTGQYAYWFDTDQADDWVAMPGGTNYTYVYRATPGSGAWTSTTTRRMLAALELATWAEPAGGGGVPVYGGHVVRRV